MQPVDLISLLETLPAQQRRRCALAINAIQREHWPAATCSLRMAAKLVQEWAVHANQLADWCEAQRTAGIADSPSPTALARRPANRPLPPPGKPTLESLEAGLTALAHFFGPEHATAVRNAMGRSVAGERLHLAPRRVPLPTHPSASQDVGTGVSA